MPHRNLLSTRRGRRFFRWVFGYIAGAWILLELAAFLVEMFEGPSLLVQGLLSVFAFGFVLTLILAWHHGEKGPQPTTRGERLALGIVTLTGLLVTGRIILGGLDGAEGSGAGPPLPFGTPSALADTRIQDPREADLAIAVLPFVRLDGAEGDDAFADGVTEDIIYELSLVPGFRVISRTSSSRYRESDRTVGEIGEELGVDLLLEGSARRFGEEARIVAQLIDVRSAEHLWSGSYDRNVKDILRVQAEVAEEIVRALATALDMEAPAVAPTHRTAAARPVDPEAYRAYVEGRGMVRSHDPSRVEEGARLLANAVEREPELEPALAALAELLEPGAGFPFHASDDLAAALPGIRTFARRTLEEAAHGSGVPAQRTRFGWRLAVDSGSGEDAREALALTLAENPNDADARRWYGILLAEDGRVAEAMEQLRIARAVDPLSPTLEAALGSLHLLAGQDGDAVLAFDRAVALAPGHAGIRIDQALALGLSNHEAQGITVLDALSPEMADQPSTLGARGFLLARQGRTGEARAILARLEAADPGDAGRPAALALVHAGLGNEEEVRRFASEAQAGGRSGRMSPAFERALSVTRPQ